MITLGIETSCDETSIALVKENKILACETASSISLHSKYGGIVPEIATRKQVEFISIVLKRALRKARCTLKQIDLLSVTQGPGLVGSLMVGISFAKSLSLALGRPIVGVDHILSHLFVNLLCNSNIEFPFIGLVISGGHTSILKVESFRYFKVIGQTQDDSIGEAFDKVSRILGLGYPGGPYIEKAASLVTEKNFVRFPKPIVKSKPYDFSFSGIKTAVLYYVNRRGGIDRLPKEDVSNIAGGFQKVVCDTVAEQVVKVCVEQRISRLLVGGGVSANTYLRRRLRDIASFSGVNVFIPERPLCIDNGAQTAILGSLLYKDGRVSDLYMDAYTNFPPS